MQRDFDTSAGQHTSFAETGRQLDDNDVDTCCCRSCSSTAQGCAGFAVQRREHLACEDAPWELGRAASAMACVGIKRASKQQLANLVLSGRQERTPCTAAAASAKGRGRPAHILRRSPLLSCSLGSSTAAAAVHHLLSIVQQNKPGASSIYPCARTAGVVSHVTN